MLQTKRVIKQVKTGCCSVKSSGELYLRNTGVLLETCFLAELTVGIKASV